MNFKPFSLTTLLIAGFSALPFAAPAQTSANPAVEAAQTIYVPEGFVVLSGKVYHIHDGKATPPDREDAVRGALNGGLNDLSKLPARLTPDQMLTMDGRIIPLPQGVIFTRSTQPPLPTEEIGSSRTIGTTSIPAGQASGSTPASGNTASAATSGGSSEPSAIVHHPSNGAVNDGTFDGGFLLSGPNGAAVSSTNGQPNPRGTATNPNGTTTNINGTVSNDNGVPNVTGTGTANNNGTATTNARGTTINPNGTTTNINGTTSNDNGVPTVNVNGTGSNSTAQSTTNTNGTTTNTNATNGTSAGANATVRTSGAKGGANATGGTAGTRSGGGSAVRSGGAAGGGAGAGTGGGVKR